MSLNIIKVSVANIEDIKQQQQLQGGLVKEHKQRNQGLVFNVANEFKDKFIIQMNRRIWKTVIFKKFRGESGQKVRNALGT